MDEVDFISCSIVLIAIWGGKVLPENTEDYKVVGFRKLKLDKSDKTTEFDQVLFFPRTPTAVALISNKKMC